ncbi:MAG: GHKL domain-containing protein [Anaerolineae bacterium]|nr:GHKL domain-containing protein [Anaerolineae bacterium]
MQNDELRQVQQDLEAARQKYIDLYNHAPVGYFTLNQEGVIIDLNLTGAQLLQREQRWLIGKPLLAHLTAPSKSLFIAHLDAVFTTKTHQSCQLTIQTLDGIKTHVQLESIVATSNNEAVVCHSTATDITQRAQIQEALERQTEALKNSNAELEMYAYVASHDLQEPLRTITSYLQMLESRYSDQLDEKGSQIIKRTVNAAKRMHTLIQDLLSLSRINSQTSHIEPVDLGLLVEQVTQYLQRAIEEEQAIISYTDLPTISGDATQLAQVFQNLISNAIKFRSSEPPKIHITATQQGKHWRFSIRDNGIGMDPELTKHIFIIFKRLHERDNYKGNGIGLAICKKIVEQHNGRIWVESEPNQGSTFFFTLPIEPPELHYLFPASSSDNFLR